MLRGWSCGISLMALIVAAQPAFAQKAPPADRAADSAPEEEILVTARKSVETPVERIKEQSSAIVDSITAEEIEKTGDITLPEALDRVVGVSSDGFFSSSDAGYVSLRGFSSIYNSIDVDGNPIFFTSQNNRGAQIGMFPSAIVKETSVYKTVTPDIDPNSIGGHISLRTLRAFDGGNQTYLKAGGRLGFPEQGSRVQDGVSYQVYGAGKFTFGADRQFGLVFGFNRQRTADADDLGSVSGYSQLTGPDGKPHDVINGNVFADSAVDKETRNTAIFAKLETRIEDKLYAFISGNLFDETKNYYIQRAGPFIAPTGGRTVTQTGPGLATFTNGQGQVREFDYIIDRKAKVVGAGLDYRVADRATIVLRGNYTDYSNDTFTRNLGAGFRLNGINGSYDITGDTPIIRPNDTAAYNNPANWAFSNTANTSTSAAYLRYQPLRDNVYTLGATLNFNNQANAEGFGASAGVNWVRLDRSFDQRQDFYALRPGVTVNLAQVSPAGATMLGNAAARQDYDSFWDFMLANGVARRDDAPTTDYRLREDALGAHAVAYYAIGGLKLLAGLRYEHTSDVTDTGQFVAGVLRPLHRSKQFGNWLPNVQASYDVSERLKLRGAFTKTIGRADFQDFAPGITTTFDANGVTQINGSNADIGPRVSTNYDASLEYYLDDGVLAVAVFQKDLDNEIFRQRTEIRDAGGVLTEIRTVPLNNGSARLRGIELTASKRKLSFLPAPLDRFGVDANFTYLDGQWDVVFTDGSTRSVNGLRSQPKWLASLRVSYDAGPLDLNVNYRAKGRTFTGTFGVTQAEDIYVRSYGTLDLQANLAITKQVRLKVDARNVTRSYQVQTTGIEDSIFNALGAGRSYWVGLHFKY